jgi:hypothetical protein
MLKLNIQEDQDNLELQNMVDAIKGVHAMKITTSSYILTA